MSKWRRVWLSLLSTLLALVFSGVVEATTNLRQGGHFHVDGGLWLGSFVVWLWAAGTLMSVGWFLAIPLVLLLSSSWIARRSFVAVLLGTGIGPLVLFLIAVYAEFHNTTHGHYTAEARNLVYMATGVACLTSAIYVFLVRRHPSLRSR